MNRDKTGPEGKGPRTGRGKGPCSIDDSKVSLMDIFNGSLGRGRGLGRGLGRRRFEKN